MYVRLGHNDKALSMLQSTTHYELTDKEKSQRGTAGIQKILEHTILYVLNPNSTSTENCETCLHEEDHSSREDKEEVLKLLGLCSLLYFECIGHALEYFRRIPIRELLLTSFEYTCGHGERCESGNTVMPEDCYWAVLFFFKQVEEIRHLG